MGRFFEYDKNQLIDNFVYQPPFEMMSQALKAQQEGLDNQIASAKLMKDLNIEHINDPQQKEEVQKLQETYNNKVDGIVTQILSDPLNWKDKAGKIRETRDELFNDVKYGNISRIQKNAGEWKKMQENLSKITDPQIKAAAEADAMKKFKSTMVANPEGFYDTSKYEARDLYDYRNLQEDFAEAVKKGLGNSSDKRVVDLVGKMTASIKEKDYAAVNKYLRHISDLSVSNEKQLEDLYQAFTTEQGVLAYRDQMLNLGLQDPFLGLNFRKDSLRNEVVDAEDTLDADPLAKLAAQYAHAGAGNKTIIAAGAITGSAEFGAMIANTPEGRKKFVEDLMTVAEDLGDNAIKNVLSNPNTNIYQKMLDIEKAFASNPTFYASTNKPLLDKYIEQRKMIVEAASGYLDPSKFSHKEDIPKALEAMQKAVQNSQNAEITFSDSSGNAITQMGNSWFGFQPNLIGDTGYNAPIVGGVPDPKADKTYLCCKYDSNVESYGIDLSTGEARITRVTEENANRLMYFTLKPRKDTATARKGEYYKDPKMGIMMPKSIMAQFDIIAYSGRKATTGNNNNVFAPTPEGDSLTPKPYTTNFALIGLLNTFNESSAGGGAIR